MSCLSKCLYLQNQKTEVHADVHHRSESPGIEVLCFYSCDFILPSMSIVRSNEALESFTWKKRATYIQF